VPAVRREAQHWGLLRPLLAYSVRVRAIDREILGLVPVILVLTGTLAGMAILWRVGSVGFDPAVFPVGAAGFIEHQNSGGRIFTKDQWGGYLIYRFAGHIKVFIDGRSDFYGRQLLEIYAQVA